MRESFNRPVEHPTDNPDLVDPKAANLQRLTDLRDAMASEDIKNNAEVPQTPSRIGAL